MTHVPDLLHELSERAAARSERTLAAIFAEADAKAAQVRALALRRTCRVCGKGMVAGQPADWTAHGVCDPGYLEATSSAPRRKR